MLQQLPALTYLDLSRIMRGSSSSSGAGHTDSRQALLALLQGSQITQPEPQQQQQQDNSNAAAAQQGVVASTLTAATTSSSSSSSSLFKRLQQLECVDSPLFFSEQIWAGLSGLNSLNLSVADVFRGSGLARLQLLQCLVLNGEPGRLSHYSRL
jgi:hypothetical protein